MSDTVLFERPGGLPHSLSRCLFERNARPLTSFLSSSRTLTSLPFDILLLIAEHLEPEDVVVLQGISRPLREFAISRPVWLQQAARMLDLCKPLPINAFQRVCEPDARTLARLVCRAQRLQHTWTKGQPMLSKPYREISAPPDEDIVWLSPITSKYTLCCTKSGKVLCWDLAAGDCVAQWHSGAEWEIWKCRVEFEERTVYFAMAKKIDTRNGTDCQLMALTFPEVKDGVATGKAEFKELCFFRFPGHVISVYLLDPLRRLLSAYIWIPSSNTLGLYLLLDWDVPVYVYINTGISCDPVREWSCIGYDPENIVIHAEEKGGQQFFYPYSFLQKYATRIPPTTVKPPLIRPPRSVCHPFIENRHPYEGYQVQSSHFVRQWWPTLPHARNIRRRSCTIVLLTMRVPEGLPPTLDAPPPGTHLFTIAQHYFSIPLQTDQLRWWYVREPFEIVCIPHVGFNEDPEAEGLDDGPPVAVVQIPIQEPPAEGNGNGAFANLLQAADGIVNNFTYYLYGNNNDHGDGNENQVEPAQPQDEDVADFHTAHAHENVPAHLEHVDVLDGEDLLVEDDAGENVHIVPLIAVDFGCAVWLEYVAYGSEEKRLRFVTFPPVDVDRSAGGFDCLSRPGEVRTLDVPPEIDLGKVCHVGVDQAQGTIILGLTTNQVYIMRFE